MSGSEFLRRLLQHALPRGFQRVRHYGWLGAAVPGLRYRLDVPSELPPVSISLELRHNVFLAAKEVVTNVVHHAQAQSVWIRLKLEPSAFTLEILDDGRGPAGMAGERAQSRNGLKNMRKRM